jgi:FMN phosphatase YigB (HAD superfamily)
MIMPVKTVLFDLGNVLSHDGHETYLTHEVHGLALGLGQSKEVVNQKVNHVFRKYAILETALEADFWHEIADSLGVELSAEAVNEVKRQVDVTNPEAIKSFELLKSHGIALGIISNSSPFFYELQSEPLHLEKYSDPNLLFLSHKRGVLKANGLFEIAADTIDLATTCIIEDRMSNVEYAQSLGFQAVHYAFDSGESLLAVIEKIVAIK